MAETTSMKKVILMRRAGAGGNEFIATTTPKFRASSPVATRLMPWRIAIQMMGMKLK